MYHNVTRVKPARAARWKRLPALLAAAGRTRSTEAAAERTAAAEHAGVDIDDGRASGCRGCRRDDTTTATTTHAAHHHHEEQHLRRVALVLVIREIFDRARDLLQHRRELIVGAGAAAGDLGELGGVDGFHGVGGHGSPRVGGDESRLQQSTCQRPSLADSRGCTETRGYRLPKTSPAVYGRAWTQAPVLC